MKKKVQFRINWKALIMGLFSTIAMSIGIFLIQQLELSNTISLFIEVFCSGVIYVTVNIVMKNALMFELIEKIKEKFLYKIK